MKTTDLKVGQKYLIREKFNYSISELLVLEIAETSVKFKNYLGGEVWELKSDIDTWKLIENLGEGIL